MSLVPKSKKSRIASKHKGDEGYYQNRNIKGNGLIEKYFQFKKQFERKFVIK